VSGAAGAAQRSGAERNDPSAASVAWPTASWPGGYFNCSAAVSTDRLYGNPVVRNCHVVSNRAVCKFIYLLSYLLTYWRRGQWASIIALHRGRYSSFCVHPGVGRVVFALLAVMLRCLDLYCDVIGTMKTVAWSYRGRKIAGTGGATVLCNVNSARKRT